MSSVLLKFAPAPSLKGKIEIEIEIEIEIDWPSFSLVKGKRFPSSGQSRRKTILKKANANCSWLCHVASACAPCQCSNLPPAMPSCLHACCPPADSSLTTKQAEQSKGKRHAH